MKGIDIFCASQAAYATIRPSMNQGSSSSSSSSSFAIYLGGGGRAIDRHNPIIRDPRRLGKSFSVPSCSSQPPISPKPLSHSHHHHHHHHHHNHHHQNKNVTNITNTSSKPSNEKSHNHNTHEKKIKIKNKSSTTVKQPPSDQEKRKSRGSSTTTAANDLNNDNNRKSWSCSSRAAAGDFISPPGSSRYLLSDQEAFFKLLSKDFDPLNKLLPPEPVVEAEPPYSESAFQKDDQSNCAFNKPISSSSARSPDQVVVLRVSLHCRGCERKVKKHISIMEGVSSFNIDFAAKKVTVVGNVMPMGVIASISKVKNAQIWTPAAASAMPAFSHTNSSEINKNSQANLISS